MLRKDYNRGNAYFDTYHIFDTDAGHYVGIVEDHCRGVKNRYFVGWKFPGNHYIPGTFQAGKTETFCTLEETIKYITSKE